jgi:hypothetical protein
MRQKEMSYAPLRVSEEQDRTDSAAQWDGISREDFFDPDWEEEDPPLDPELDDLAAGGK